MPPIKRCARNAARAIAIAVTVAASGLLFHYYIRLRLLEHTVVVVVPGKWVWAECRTRLFSATIEEVSISGIMVSVDAPLPVGLPCNKLGITAQGDGKYFFPFRTVLGLTVNGDRIWSNPNSM
jgi:hypothetical protein